jgi:WD40 repeat protein
MGVVYEAWQNSMDRQVALKVLPVGIAADTKACTRFMREAQTAGKLNHQNIVGVHSTGVEEGTPWYSMEYVEGETLSQILGKLKETDESAETPFGVPRDDVAYYSKLARCFADVADGLQHAHSKGVVHRDIKPSNLILEHEGRLRILDFGLARLEGEESLTLSGDFVGTPAYMSPEQAKRRKIPVDHRTDIYSLGATLYELLTHEQPFRGKDHNDTLSQIIERDPRPPRQLNSRVPADLETIVLKCLRKDTRDRYGTAEALGQDLRRFVRGDAVEAQAQSLWEKTARRLWRQRRLAVAVGALLIVGLVALAVSNVLIARARDEATLARDEATLARNKARHELYVSSMRLAMEDWYSGNYLGFTETLERYVPEHRAWDPRGWEWYYLQSLRERDAEITLDGDSAALRTVAWSPDGRLLAAGGSDGSVKIWDVDTTKLFVKLDGKSSIKTVVWHPDGTRLAAGCTDGTVIIWDVETEREPLSFVAHSQPRGTRSIAWSLEGRWLATCGDEEVKIWDGLSDKLLKPLEAGPRVDCVCWSRDGKRLAAGFRKESLGRVKVWDTSSWEELEAGSALDDEPHTLAWSWDGRWLAAASVDQQIAIWNTKSWDDFPGYQLGHEGMSHSLAWQPHGVLLASAGGNGVVKVWNPLESKEPVRLRGHAGKVLSVTWNPAGTRVASASQDGTVKVWDPAQEQRSGVLPGEFPATWSPDGQLLAMEDGVAGVVRVVDASSGETVRKLGPYKLDAPQGLAFHPSSPWLAVASGGGTDNLVWDWQSGDVVYPFGEKTKGFVCVDWASNGELLAAGRKEGSFVIYDAATGERVKVLRGHEGRAVDAAWSPDGERLATVSQDQSVRIWERDTWGEPRVVRRPSPSNPSDHSGPMDGLSWSPDSDRLATGGSEGTISIWDVATGDEVVKLSRHSARTLSVSWSPDGSRMASGSEDRTIKIWDVSTGRELLTLRGQRWCAASLQWHPDGWRLLSAEGFPNSVRIWDARPKERSR